MTYFCGEFEDRDSIIRALRALKEKGLKPQDLDVFSSVPLELPRSALERRSHMSLGVVIGAITFFLLAVGFVYFTQYDYKIVTGGMPLFSFWATGVVFYEFTMFGAILTSLFLFLYESGLLGRRRLPAPVFEPGSICLRVHCRPEQQEAVSRLLETSGARNLGAAGETR
jgi:hypothetical protein